MKILLAALLVGGSLLLYRFKPVPGQGELLGRWTVAAAPSGWKIVPGMDVLVSDAEIQIRLGPVVTSKMQYTTDPEDHTVDAHGPGEEMRRGVYRLDGDMLTLCVSAPGGERPPTPDDGTDGAMRWVLKRAPSL